MHVGDVLSRLGLSIRAEEVHRTPVRGVRIPDFTISHPLGGLMLGEAEVGEWEYDSGALERLRRRVERRFGETLFKGYDFILLIIYKRGDLERLAGLEESRVKEGVEGIKVGLGLAVRGEAFGLESHYEKYLGVPVDVKSIPVVLDMLVNEFLSQLKKSSPQVKVRVDELVDSLEGVIDTYSNALALSVVGERGLEEKLKNVALKLSIAWDYIRDPVERAKVTFKLILLLETLTLILYELARRGSSETLRPPGCDNVGYEGFIDLIKQLLTLPGGRPRYAELNSELLELLESIPPSNLLDDATAKICREVVNGYPLLRRMGWDILSTMYQRMLSETFRHAFATFYTKIPAARLLVALAIERFEDKVVDVACGTGSLLLASVERRLTLLTGDSLKSMLEKAKTKNTPVLDVAREDVLTRTVGLDALKQAIHIASLNLRIATHTPPLESLNLYHVPVGERRAGSLDLLTEMATAVPVELRRLLSIGFDVVLMNPPFTRSDRIPALIGRTARKILARAGSEGRLTFGSVPVRNVFTAGLAKPFMVLADRLVRDGGRIASVLPSSALSRPSWRDIREGLVKGYNIDYIVVSWAPGTPSFSSDTKLREILLIARKREEGEASRQTKIIGLLKKVDELSYSDVEILTREAVKMEEGYGFVISGGTTIGFISVLGRDIVEKFSDNLYRLIAFRRPELLKFHLDLVGGSGIRLGSLFDVGSVIDHTSGLNVAKRNSDVNVLHERPAIWDSGEALGVRVADIDRAPWKVGVIREDEVRVKYWRSQRSFYTANLFTLRRGQLDTQYLLAIKVGEGSVSNVWWPLRVKDSSDTRLAEKFLVFMNSTFGFIHLLGERLETRGLWVEYKKQHTVDMLLPDLRLAPPPSMEALKALREPLPRFKDYIEAMARLSEKSGEPWYHIAREQAEMKHELSPRAVLDLEVYSWLKHTFNTEPPIDLYVTLRDEVSLLREIMEGNAEEEEVIEDEVSGRIAGKHTSLDRWFQ